MASPAAARAADHWQLDGASRKPRCGYELLDEIDRGPGVADRIDKLVGHDADLLPVPSPAEPLGVAALDGVEDRKRTISPTGFCLDPVHQCSTDAAALEIPVNQKRADLGPVWRVCGLM
jgi:hypothetical protein